MNNLPASRKIWEPDKIGIITNSWAQALKNGAGFEHLAAGFRREGFRQLEIRDGDYLRRSGPGQLLDRIEEAMVHYTDEEWLEICEQMQPDRNPGRSMKPEHVPLAEAVGSFLKELAGLQISYAIAHPWLTAPEDILWDDRRIITAIKLAYLLDPARARLRLVAPALTGDFKNRTAEANLKRYKSLLPDYPLTLAVENNRGVLAARILDLARAAGLAVAYDQANIFQDNGQALHDPQEFWELVDLKDLTSIHLKQRNLTGIMSGLGPGLVDFAAIFRRVQGKDYQGDWLLELAPAADPLKEALASREYLSGLL